MSVTTSFTDKNVMTSFTQASSAVDTCGLGHPIMVIVASGKRMSMASQVASDATIDIRFPSATARQL